MNRDWGKNVPNTSVYKEALVTLLLALAAFSPENVLPFKNVSLNSFFGKQSPGPFRTNFGSGVSAEQKTKGGENQQQEEKYSLLSTVSKHWTSQG